MVRRLALTALPIRERHVNTSSSSSQYHPAYNDKFVDIPILTPPSSQSRSPSPLSSRTTTEQRSSLGSFSVSSIFLPSKSPRLRVKAPPSKMIKNGIVQLYVSHASDHIAECERARKPMKISRANVELELLTEIDRGVFPIEWKMAWYSAILTSPNFEAFWFSTSHRLHLPPSCIARFIPDHSLLSYEAPSISSSDTASLPELTPDRGTSHDFTPSAYAHHDTSNDNDPYVSPEAAALARLLGGEDAADEDIPPTATSAYELPGTDPHGSLGNDAEWTPEMQLQMQKPKAKKSPPTARKEPAKARKTPAKPKAAKTPKRDFAAAVAGAGQVVLEGSPAKKVRKERDGTAKGTPRKRKMTAKAKELVAEASGL